MPYFIIKHYQVKRIMYTLIMLFLFTIGCYKVFVYADGAEEKKLIALYQNTSRLSNKEITLIKEGDFILRRGFGYFSDIIATKLNNGKYDITHAGIIVKKNDSLFVLHSLSSDVSKVNGVQMQPLDTFLKYSSPGKIIITRVKNSTDCLGSEIAAKALCYLNKNIPFDEKGNFDDHSAFFCTELIWHILEKDLKCFKLPQGYAERKKHFYSVENMYNDNYFDIIINQFKV